MSMGWSKEQQCQNSPGGNRKSKQAKAESTKGQEFEKEVQAELQKTSKKPVRRNNQRREGGGLGQADIDALQGWHCEVKNEKTLRMPAYHKQLKEDCPKDKRPALVYAQDGKPWLSIRLEDRMNLASDLIEAAGGVVEFY